MLMMMSNEVKKVPKMGTIKEAIETFGFTYSYFRNACLKKEIAFIRVGNKYYINFDKFIDYLNGEYKEGEAND